MCNENLKNHQTKIMKGGKSISLAHLCMSTCYKPGAFAITQHIWQLSSVYFGQCQLVTISPSSWPRTDHWPVTGRCFQQYYHVATRYDDHVVVRLQLYCMANNFHVWRNVTSHNVSRDVPRLPVGVAEATQIIVINDWQTRSLRRVPWRFRTRTLITWQVL